MRSFKIALVFVLAGCTSDLIRPRDQKEMNVVFPNPEMEAGMAFMLGNGIKLTIPDTGPDFALEVSPILNLSKDYAERDNHGVNQPDDVFHLRLTSVGVTGSDNLERGIDPMTARYEIPPDRIVNLWPFWEVTENVAEKINAGDFYATGVIIY